MAAIQLFFLHHSGFAVETPSKILVFDYWRDPAGVVSQLEKTRKPLWFFVSHRHEDHFNPQIAAFQQKTAHYIVNEEVPLAISASEKMQRLRVYDTIVIDDVTITQYGSTDEGGSFYVRTDGIQLFHAGDLNRWHWNGDTVQNTDRAKENFIREMQHLSGLTTDFAFFPVDARLESAREWGVSGFFAGRKGAKSVDSYVLFRLRVATVRYLCSTIWTYSAMDSETSGGYTTVVIRRGGEQVGKRRKIMAETKTIVQKRTHIANYILVIAAIVLLLAYPVRDLFWGGLLTHVAGAALIGGLADWYAVTALFRKPLGISFKTALIPNSKERIAEMARQMVEHEILTVPNMYNVLKHHPVLGTTLDYLRTEKGFQSAERIAGQILNTFLYTVDMKTIVRIFANVGGQAIERIELAPIMSKAIRIGLRGESGKDFLDFMILHLEILIQSDTMKKYMGEIYEASIQQYANRHPFMKLFIKPLLKSEIFSSRTVAEKLSQKFLTVLAEAKQPNSLKREQALRYLWAQTDKIEFNAAWKEGMEGYKNRMYKNLVTRPDTKEAWQRYVQDPDRQKRVCTAAAKYVVGKLEAWRESPDQVEQVNRAALAFVARELKRLQVWFGKTAQQEILQYDSRYLAEQLESRVWYDLQMIRINGSLVGAVLGAIIFFIMYSLKGGV